ncbi:MAG: asparaginase [Flavobacteriales bacterium]
MEVSILLIYTGGTIGMEVSEEDGSLSPLPFENLLSYVPELNRLNCNIDHYTFKHPVDSSDANPQFWNDVAEVIENNYIDYDGFVVLHGTDTMAYTASALSIMLEGLNKPVVLTGSQLPMGMLRTDGRENLISSIEIASSLDNNGDSILQEVAVYFEYSLYRGNRCHKFSSEHFDAIISPNYPPLAEAGVNIHWNKSALQRKKATSTFLVHKNWGTQLSIVKFFPGISADQLRYQLGQPGIKAIILETYGSGNIPMKNEILSLIEERIKSGVAVINVSQCRKGAVDQRTYASGLRLSKLGVISAEDMTMESVVVKTMHLLGRELESSLIKQEFQQNYAGEIYS